MNFDPRTKAKEEQEDANSELYVELLEVSNKLRRKLNIGSYSEIVEQNVSDAIVFLDCARENLLSEAGDFRVAPQVVRVPKS